MYRLVVKFLLTLLLFSPWQYSFSQELIYETESDLSLEEKERRLPPGIDRSPHYFPLIPGEFSHARINPPNWWIGMEETVVELLIYDRNIAAYMAQIDHQGVTVLESIRMESPNYKVLRIKIDEDALAGNVDIHFKKNFDEEISRSMNWELKDRTDHHLNIQGLFPGDVIYLMMPDRFANGDYSNDSFKEMNQQGIDRRRIYYRHGGDLQGIIDRLDYLEDLGVTALWLNPVFENDQPYESYHGYAITDHYNVDRRFGDNDLYRSLSEKALDRGIKMVHDVIYNHIGDHHWIFRDLPDKDWFHWHDEFTRTTYRSTTLMDPYGSGVDRDLYQQGWFDNHMPDLNQNNERVANFLIQNTIWAIEYFKLNGLRIDTYSYSDLDFMSELVQRVYNEYPKIGIFGETWVHGPGVQAWFAEQTNPFSPFNSGMEGLTDFQLYYAILEALNEPHGWTTGIEKLYYTLAQDHLYKNPFAHVTFVDNHDLDRFLSAVGDNVEKFKAGLVFLFTTRGIPMIYYGTEIAMKNRANPDGWVREGFPGGWREDAVNKFEEAGRTELENEVFGFIRKLINLRTSTPAFQNGKMIQFVPDNEVYAFIRSDEGENYLILIHASGSSRTHSLERYLSELNCTPLKVINVLTNEAIENRTDVFLPEAGGMILKLICD
ncbi:MAG: alpha-amylase [Saprospirales bacterium]|nr:MAG: alpha-amylase [Saprospirales bacterium]